MVAFDLGPFGLISVNRRDRFINFNSYSKSTDFSFQAQVFFVKFSTVCCGDTMQGTFVRIFCMFAYDILLWHIIKQLFLVLANAGHAILQWHLGFPWWHYNKLLQPICWRHRFFDEFRKSLSWSFYSSHLIRRRYISLLYHARYLFDFRVESHHAWKSSWSAYTYMDTLLLPLKYFIVVNYIIQYQQVQYTVIRQWMQFPCQHWH